jgi:hypothetical protein
MARGVGAQLLLVVRLQHDVAQVLLRVIVVRAREHQREPHVVHVVRVVRVVRVVVKQAAVVRERVAAEARGFERVHVSEAIWDVWPVVGVLLRRKVQLVVLAVPIAVSPFRACLPAVHAPHAPVVCMPRPFAFHGMHLRVPEQVWLKLRWSWEWRRQHRRLFF